MNKLMILSFMVLSFQAISMEISGDVRSIGIEEPPVYKFYLEAQCLKLRTRISWGLGRHKSWVPCGYQVDPFTYTTEKDGRYDFNTHWGHHNRRVNDYLLSLTPEGLKTYARDTVFRHFGYKDEAVLKDFSKQDKKDLIQKTFRDPTFVYFSKSSKPKITISLSQDGDTFDNSLFKGSDSVNIFVTFYVEHQGIEKVIASRTHSFFLVDFKGKNSITIEDVDCIGGVDTKTEGEFCVVMFNENLEYRDLDLKSVVRIVGFSDRESGYKKKSHHLTKSLRMSSPKNYFQELGHFIFDGDTQ